MKNVFMFFGIVALIGIIMASANKGYLEVVQAEIMVIGLIVFGGWYITRLLGKEKDA